MVQGSSLKVVYVCGGWISLFLGVLGVFLPLVPTTPFVLLAAFCFSKGSPRWHAWLLQQPRFGPLIQDWEAHGSISRPAKLAATISMVVLFSITFLVVNVGFAIQGFLSLIGVGVLGFIWTRPLPGSAPSLAPQPVLE